MPNFNPAMAFWQGRDDAQRNQLDMQQNQRRNALADIVQQRETTQWRQGQDDRQQEQKLRSTLALIEQADGAPPEVQAQVLATISQQDPDFGRVFGQMPPADAIRSAGNGIRTKLGIPVSRMQAEQGGVGFGNVNPGDYTPESLATYERTRNFADLKRQYAPQQAWVGSMAGGIGAIPRSGGGVGAPQMVVTPDAQIEGDARAAAAKAAAEAKARAQAEFNASVQKKVSDVQNVGDVLDLAVPLVDAATGSAFGAGADFLANAFGVSPSGDQAIGALKILEGKIILTMPRMEGPQSNADALLYRQMAAQLGDPTVPRDKKKAAIRTIRALNGKYESRNSKAPATPAAPAAGKSYKTKSGATVTISE